MFSKFNTKLAQWAIPGAVCLSGAFGVTTQAQAQDQYRTPSPNYERLERQPYQGPGGANGPVTRGTLREQWGFNNYADGRSIEGCWVVENRQFLDTDGRWKVEDRVVGHAINKNRSMCNLTNPLSPLIRELPAPGPQHDRRSQYNNGF